MSKILFLFLFFILLTNCSLNKNSKFWSETKNLKDENALNYEEIFPTDESLKKEFNSSLKLKFKSKLSNNTSANNYLNNNRRLNFDGDLKKSSRYKFSKIKNFYQYEPEIIFHKENIIFFNNKGTILKFNKNSKLEWQKNYYTKYEKKLKPVLQFAKNNNFLIVADNIAKYFMINIETGELIWSKNSLAPFNSQIKIFKDKFYIIDYSNTLRCFSLKNGNELWSVKTQNTLIRSQKKLSMVIVKDILYFNNSIGDISAVNLNNGELLWQLPTQNTLVYESAFSLETSELITDNKTLFFSNNQNQLFSIDLSTGSFNWEAKINSNIRPTVIGNILFTISQEGYLFLLDKKNGNIIRVTNVFSDFKLKKRKEINPTGFIVGSEKIFLSTNNGRLLVIDSSTGKTDTILKIDNQKILRPVVFNQKLFVIKDNAIIKLN